MAIQKVLVTGSCGLVGSTAVEYFAQLGCEVTGIDNNNRKKWFGEEGSIDTARERLSLLDNYKGYDLDICDSSHAIVKHAKPDLIIHCAGQPSHDFSADHPVIDFKNNALATVNLLESTRKLAPEATFIFVSTNKVYGESPHSWLQEEKTRYNCDIGVPEHCPIDQTMHSPFGVSKVAADIMVQEYGRYYGLNTVCFRCGCITGVNHQGVEFHGFLNYLCKCAKEGREYTIYGHKGKQVRDNLHAHDLARAFHEYAKNPRPAKVYNIGGGYENSCSIIEAIQMIEEISGLKVKTKEGPPRKGDHICYYSNIDKFKRHYPDWGVLINLKKILAEMLI